MLFVLVLSVISVASSAPASASGTCTWPVIGPVIRGFDPPGSPYEAGHRGIDIAAPDATLVRAPAAGVVTFAGEKTGYGTLVEVSHGNGLVTRYGHNSGLAVTVGRTVQRGDTLAYIGSTGRSTGPHVHFEVLKNGRQVDPLTFIGR